MINIQALPILKIVLINKIYCFFSNHSAKCVFQLHILDKQVMLCNLIWLVHRTLEVE